MGCRRGELKSLWLGYLPKYTSKQINRHVKTRRAILSTCLPSRVRTIARETTILTDDFAVAVGGVTLAHPAHPVLVARAIGEFVVQRNGILTHVLRLSRFIRICHGSSLLGQHFSTVQPGQVFQSVTQLRCELPRLIAPTPVARGPSGQIHARLTAQVKHIL
jgi:hypothetical protein